MEPVSVTICSRDGAARLPATLASLLAQEDPGVPWEVVLVDNGSTDGTAALARSLWPSAHSAPLRVVEAPGASLGEARSTAFREARSPILVIVDDDNRPAPGFLARAVRLMEEHPGAALAGGPSSLLGSTPPPPWFAAHSFHYAVGSKGRGPRSVAANRSLLWGAGMVVRRAFLEEAAREGWTPIARGREGAYLGGGEDTEYCWLARLSGWDILYDPGLAIGHAVDPSRLAWGYLRRLVRQGAESAVLLDPYRFALRDGVPLARLRASWTWQLLQAAWKAADPLRLAPALASLAGGGEGSGALVRWERRLGRLRGLWRFRRGYGARVEAVREAPWRRRPGERAGTGE